MKNTEYKTKISTIALILILTMMASMLVIPTAQATEIPTVLRINVGPNPIGVTQTATVSAFMNIPPPTANGFFGDLYEDLTIEIEYPDGSKDSLGPYTSDPSGGVYTQFTPTTVGEYTFQAFYPGQTLTGYNSFYPESPGRNLDLVGSEMLPSESEKFTLVVQQEAISGYQTPSLPNEYWSRPIHTLNYEWASVLGGNWLGLGASGGGAFSNTGYYDATGNVQPYTTAPKTAHILWTKPTAFGGQVGGPIEPTLDSQYHSTSPLTGYFEPIIINGVLFYDSWSTYSITKDHWIAVDLRTGETLWEKPCGITGNEWLRYGQVLKWHTMHVFGSTAYLWSLEGTALSDTRPVPRGNITLRLYEPMTCTYVCEIVNAQNLNMIADTEANEEGTLLGWYVSDGNLILWNSTRALAYPNGFDPEVGPARAFRPKGTIDWSAGIEWSIPLPTTLNGNPINLGISRITPEVILVREEPAMAAYGTISKGYQITAGYDARTGQLLWGPLNQTLHQFHFYGVEGVRAARDGVYVLIDQTTNEAYGYSLENGNLLWGPVSLPSLAWSFLGYGVEIAYDTVYIWDFGGFVNALDLETGNIKWTFSRGSVGYDSPFGITPLWPYAGSICDGILFLGEGNLYNPPVHPNARMLALNCTSGKLIWSILGYTPRIVSAFADSMMVRWISYDKQIYTFGKGQTETSVTIQNDVITHGSSVMIKGTVTDESPGTKNSDRVARFPKGVPAVADEDMSAWMEYIYMQQPRPEDVKGVEVIVKILDPNGDYYSETVTTDRNGMFSMMWAPTIVGDYHVTVLFEGSESYYASEATTAFGVDQAPEKFPDVPTAEEIATDAAQRTINMLPPYPDVPTQEQVAADAASRTIAMMPAYPTSEMPAYQTIDLAIIVLVAISIIIGLYGIIKKQK